MYFFSFKMIFFNSSHLFIFCCVGLFSFTQSDKSPPLSLPIFVYIKRALLEWEFFIWYKASETTNTKNGSKQETKGSSSYLNIQCTHILNCVESPIKLNAVEHWIHTLHTYEGCPWEDDSLSYRLSSSLITSDSSIVIFIHTLKVFWFKILATIKFPAAL